MALANRGVLLTPFHSMALMCPATTEADVDRHTEEFTKVVAALMPSSTFAPITDIGRSTLGDVG